MYLVDRSDRDGSECALTYGRDEGRRADLKIPAGVGYWMYAGLLGRGILQADQVGSVMCRNKFVPCINAGSVCRYIVQSTVALRTEKKILLWGT